MCYCGNTTGKYGNATNCDIKCQGNTNQICGGFDANSVYYLPLFLAAWRMMFRLFLRQLLSSAVLVSLLLSSILLSSSRIVSSACWSTSSFWLFFASTNSKILQCNTMILQRSRIIVREAGFEPRITSSALWSIYLILQCRKNLLPTRFKKIKQFLCFLNQHLN